MLVNVVANQVSMGRAGRYRSGSAGGSTQRTADAGRQSETEFQRPTFRKSQSTRQSEQTRVAVIWRGTRRCRSATGRAEGRSKILGVCRKLAYFPRIPWSGTDFLRFP